MTIRFNFNTKVPFGFWALLILVGLLLVGLKSCKANAGEGRPLAEIVTNPLMQLRCYPLGRNEGPPIHNGGMACLNSHVALYPHPSCKLDSNIWYDNLPPSDNERTFGLRIFFKFKVLNVIDTLPGYSHKTMESIPSVKVPIGIYSLQNYCLEGTQYKLCNPSMDLTTSAKSFEYMFSVPANGRLYLRWQTRWPEYGPDWHKNWPRLYKEDTPPEYFGAVTAQINEMEVWYSNDRLNYIMITYHFDSLKMGDWTLQSRFAFASAESGYCEVE